MATREISLEDLGIVLEELTAQAPEAIRRAMQVQVQDILYHVAYRMTNRDLGVKTGTARRSMTGRVEVTDQSIKGVVGSPLRYVRAHEEGFKGPVSVRAHVRRLYGRSTALTKTGRRSTAKVVKAFASVRAHERNVDIRAKNFLRKSIQDTDKRLAPRAKRALTLLAERGRVPSFSEIAGA